MRILKVLNNVTFFLKFTGVMVPDGSVLPTKIVCNLLFRTRVPLRGGTDQLTAMSADYAERPNALYCTTRQKRRMGIFHESLFLRPAYLSSF